MKTGVHNVETWFGSVKDFIIYFETKFGGNTIGMLKFPSSHVARHANKEEMAKGVVNFYINGIHRLKYKQLSKLKFNWLKKETITQLKDAACEAVQHAVQNLNIYERVTSSSVSTNTFQINVDNSGWMLSSDMFGKIAWNLIQTSNIDKYEWIPEYELFITTPSGSIEIIGKADASKIPDLT